MKIDLVVTRHPALLDLLIELGVATLRTPIVPHANEVDLRGKHVAGVLPLSLASVCASVTEIPLTLPAELRGVELDLDTLRGVAGSPVTYVVMTVAVFEDTLVDILQRDRDAR